MAQQLSTLVALAEKTKIWSQAPICQLTTAYNSIFRKSGTLASEGTSTHLVQTHIYTDKTSS